MDEFGSADRYVLDLTGADRPPIGRVEEAVCVDRLTRRFPLLDRHKRHVPVLTFLRPLM
jgi:hypothetical protein